MGKRGLRAVLGYFSKGEWALYLGSVAVVVGSALGSGAVSAPALIDSLIGVSALIFTAKGHPLGQGLLIAFAALYGAIAYSCAYYGEVITYLGMSAPMALAALIAWLRHPYQGQKSQVTVGRLTKTDRWLCPLLTGLVTFLFYFILKALGTAQLFWSTVSVATSFAACYLTLRASPFYALAYAANDLVLIVLWLLASREDAGYGSVVVCFSVFLINDLYGFINWRRMAARQSRGK